MNTVHTPRASKIVTHHVSPPIPTRDCDWSATEDGYEPGMPIGRGATEQAAIDDLKEQLADKRLEAEARRDAENAIRNAKVWDGFLTKLFGDRS